MNKHLKVEVNEKYNYKKVSCTEGHRITNWDKEDIKSFTASTMMFCPMNYDLEQFYCITNEEYETLSAQHREAMEKEMIMREYLNNNLSGTTSN